MKKLLMLFLLLPLFSIGQTQLPMNAEGKVEYTEVVQVDSATADQLYSRAKLFFASTATSVKDITQLNDEASKTVVIKGNLPVYYKKRQVGYFKSRVTLQCKDGRYKYSITDLVHENKHADQEVSGGAIENEKPASGTFFMPKKYWELIKESGDTEVKAYIAELKKAMASTKSSDW